MAPPDTLFTGALEHRHLVHLLPLADVAVVPSIFPEAFGMVAAEAASAGTPPLVARHSGLQEIAEGLEAGYPPEHRDLTSFASGDVTDLTDKDRFDLTVRVVAPSGFRYDSGSNRALNLQGDSQVTTVERFVSGHELVSIERAHPTPVPA